MFPSRDRWHRSCDDTHRNESKSGLIEDAHVGNGGIEESNTLAFVIVIDGVERHLFSVICVRIGVFV
jgi:hypothetical protein